MLPRLANLEKISTVHAEIGHTSPEWAWGSSLQSISHEDHAWIWNSYDFSCEWTVLTCQLREPLAHLQFCTLELAAHRYFYNLKSGFDEASNTRMVRRFPTWFRTLELADNFFIWNTDLQRLQIPEWYYRAVYTLISFKNANYLQHCNTDFTLFLSITHMMAWTSYMTGWSHSSTWKIIAVPHSSQAGKLTHLVADVWTSNIFYCQKSYILPLLSLS